MADEQRLPDEAEEYRPVSMLAVFALVAGCGSALALTTQILWGLPVLAVGLAIAGIRDTAAGDSRKAGRGLALVGLALAVGFGCQAVSTAAGQYWIGQQRAVETVSRWQETIRRGDWLAAREFCTPSALPLADPFGGNKESHADHEHGSHTHDTEQAVEAPAVQAFRDLPVVRAISEHGPAAVADCRWDRDKAGGCWRVSLSLAHAHPATMAVWLYPETKDVPRLTPTSTGVEKVELWRIIRLEPSGTE